MKDSEVLREVSPETQKFWLSGVGPMKNAEAFNQEVVDFNEAAEALRTKPSKGGDGFNYFTGMTLGTRFASIRNGVYGAECDEFVLMSKQGITVVLHDNQAMEGRNPLQRYLSQKFWNTNTMVQILHIPDASETGPPPVTERKDNNGNGPEN